MFIGSMVIGIGNPDCGDDAAGLIVARRLKLECFPGVQVVELIGASPRLLECLNGVDLAYIVDASNTGAPPGTINRYDVAATELPPLASACSTHGLGLAEVIELARSLGRLPRRCVVYAIEGRRFEIGAVLSPDVAAATAEASNLIRDELR